MGVTVPKRLKTQLTRSSSLPLSLSLSRCLHTHTHAERGSVPLILRDKVDLGSLSLLLYTALSGHSSSPFFFCRWKSNQNEASTSPPSLWLPKEPSFHGWQWHQSGQRKKKKKGIGRHGLTGKICTGNINVCHCPIASAMTVEVLT